MLCGHGPEAQLSINIKSITLQITFPIFLFERTMLKEYINSRW